MDERTELRTLLVGIDAACEQVLDPLFDDDELPTLAGIVEDGTSGPLESQIPPWTASAWPSMYTGMNPGKHGVFSFLTFEGYDWDVVNATDVRERAIWELLSEQGLSSVVVNVPVTHPPRAFDGALLPGYTAPEDPDCHPDGLLADVREEIGEYRVYPENGKLADTYRDCVRTRGAAFRYLADRFEPDFGFLQFQATDSIFHRRPDDEAAIRTIYREVDRQLEATLEACGPDTVVVASDHGMGPYAGYEFRINDFLHDAGYVETARGGEGMPTWATTRDGTLKEGEEPTRSDPGTLERAMAVAAAVGLTSQRVGAALERVGLAEFVADVVPADVVQAGATRVDFPDSVASVRSRIELGVRINLEGRDPEGVVPPSEYESVRAALIDALRDVTTPDGEPVFADVAPREAYFHGPESDRAVDVVTVPADFEHFLSASLRGEQFGPPSEPWNHKLEGVVAAAGEGVDPEGDLEDAHLFDVAPTVLATLDVPADERMDGSVLDCVEGAGRREYPRLAAEESVETADETVERRLADLGYLE